MSYNILGINTSHNGSVCVLADGEIVFFLEEERLSRTKHDDFPIELLKYLSKNFQINEISLSGLGHQWSFKKITLYKSYLNLLFPNSPIKEYFDLHHTTHAFCSFTNSNFKESLVIVVDGSGSKINPLNSQEIIAETESVYYFNFFNYQNLYKSFVITDPQTNIDTSTKFINNKNTIGHIYESITELLGFKWNEAGKTMGLSSYGSFNKSIPNLVINRRGNPKLFKSISLKEVSLGNAFCKFNSSFNYLASDENLRKDLAYKLQQETQEAVGDLIEKHLKETGLKQVCCAGGYFLNCVANYYLIKRFPDVKFYFEPISSDAGVAIGGAKLAWQEKTQDTTILPQKTLYYGPKYSKEELLKGIQKYLD
jgi:carbamoyltransferase